MENIKIASSPFLKHEAKKDGTRPLQARVRINFYGKAYTFPIFVRDGKDVIYLLPNQFNRGFIVQHPKAKKYTSILLSIKPELEKYFEQQKTYNFNKDKVKEHLVKSFVQFDVDYLSLLKRDIVDMNEQYLVPKELHDPKFIFDKQVIEKAFQQIVIERDSENFQRNLLENQQEFNNDLASERKKNLPTAEVYRLGLHDKQNIFEVFGSIYYEPDVNATYEKVVVALLRFKERVKPSNRIKDLNADWLIRFFKFLHQTGQYSLSTKSLDPLKYDKSIFLQDKPFKPYKPKSLNRMIGYMKSLINGGTNSAFSLVKRGYLKDELNLKSLHLKSIDSTLIDKEGTRIEHHLNKEEIDQLYFYPFKKNKLGEYQEIFNTVNKSKSIPISIEDLDTARKMFILQTFIGGCRGFTEYRSAKIKYYSKEIPQVVTFFQNKVKKTITNPLNAYTSGILKGSTELPMIVRYNAQKAGQLVTNDNLMEQHYQKLLQTIAQIVNFEREVVIDEESYVQQPIKEIFNPYFARKSFSQTLYDDLPEDSDIDEQNRLVYGPHFRR